MLEYEMLPSPAKIAFLGLSAWDEFGKGTLCKFTNGNLTLGKLTWVYLPKINLPNVFYPGNQIDSTG